MREFFIFEIKDEFKSLYMDKPSILYNILEQIYKLDKGDLNYGYSLFKQLTRRIAKEEIDRYLFIKYHQNIPYSKRKETHYYNDSAHDEVSTLLVKRAYMLVKTNYYNSFFLKALNSPSNTYFAVDFKNQDYFFLSDMKILV